MEYDLIVNVEAQLEAKDAVDYYDGIDPKLGERFFKELSETYQKLQSNLQHYSFVFTTRKSNIRDVKLHSFPYLIIFEIRGQKVVVLSVMNTHKRPKKFKRRS